MQIRGRPRQSCQCDLSDRIEGKSVAEARQMFSIRFIHFKWTKTGILDMFLDMYEERLEQGPIAFQDWVAHEYDPEALTQRFAKRRITSR